MEEILNDNRHTNGPFEEERWLDLVAPGKWREAIVSKQVGDKNEVVARLPYVISNGKISSPVYTQTMGIWMSEECRGKKRGNEQFNTQKEIIHDLLQQLPQKADIDIILDCSQDYILPFRWEGFSIEPRFSYRISNLENLLDVEASFSKSIKRDYNRGEKLLHIDDSPNSIGDFIKLQNLTYERQGRKNPVSNEITERIIRKAIELGHGRIMLARDDDNKAHAGSFVLYDDRVCYHLMSGQDTSFGNDGAMPFLLYKEILFARDVSRVFDFEGSMVEGIEQVYRRYGGEIVTLWRITHKSLFSDCMDLLKPRVKKIIGYKM